RVAQHLLGLPGPQVRGRGHAGHAVAVPRAVIGDHVGLADQARGAHRDQVGIAGADPDAEQAARLHRGHSARLARAFTAADAIADPPRRPCTTRNSSASGLAARAALDSAAPTNPTGTPMTAAG